ncbi:MAG TPA: hypothetical protein VEQ42_07375 [Pyrinomonadaceae bacterium]|nr:hypothetical protein [Pyrinomonadaceae bacterium]
MRDALLKLWEFLSRPPLSPEATFWASEVFFLTFVLLPVWVVAYGTLARRRDERGASRKARSFDS